jgi:DNA-binding NarL/FixJ family response regulator
MFSGALSSLLERHDGIHVVGCASTGTDAVDQATAQEVDVVLMDVAMPGMDGLETTRRLRSVAPETRVIVLTGMDEDDVVTRAADAGASACLTKGALDRDVVDTIIAVASSRLNL